MLRITNTLNSLPSVSGRSIARAVYVWRYLQITIKLVLNEMARSGSLSTFLVAQCSS